MKRSSRSPRAPASNRPLLTDQRPAAQPDARRGWLTVSGVEVVEQPRGAVAGVAPRIVKGLSTKWKKGWAVLSIAAAIGLALVALAGIHLWPAGLDAMWWGAALSAAMLSALLLVPRLLAPAGAALVLMVAFVFMMDVVVRGRAAYFAREDAEDWQKTKPNTIIEFTDGNKIPAPGTRIACSERFCGFHDGKTATVISLEGVRSIQSPVPPPVPQGQPPHTSGK